MRSLALFDFDGTITKKDTFLLFIRFYWGDFRFYLGMLKNLHILLALKLGLIDGQLAKEKVLEEFFKGEDVVKFNAKALDFNKKILKKYVRKNALTKIKEHQESNDHIIVITASPNNWIENWTNEHALDLISSKLEVIDGNLTGRLVGKNCKGPEKINRLKLFTDLTQYDKIYAYGDSSGDKEMLELADHKFYRALK